MPVISAELLFPVSIGMTQSDVYSSLVDSRICSNQAPVVPAGADTGGPTSSSSSHHVQNGQKDSLEQAQRRADSPVTSVPSAAVTLALPKDIQNILTEVARTGSCSSLTWSRIESSNGETSRKRPRMDIAKDYGHSLDSLTHLQQVIYVVMTSVLDQFFHRAGYRLSHVERKKMEPQSTWSSNLLHNRNASEHLLEQRIFHQRKERLQALLLGKNRDWWNLGGPSQPQHAEYRTSSADNHFAKTFSSCRNTYEEYDFNNLGPPFTIQRIAEILLTPNRFYQQTHKLCNALEKLLLVTSSSTAFGGVMGGETSQNTREVQELTALAYERDREESEHRDRRLKRRRSSEDENDNSPGGMESSPQHRPYLTDLTLDSDHKSNPSFSTTSRSWTSATIPDTSDGLGSYSAPYASVEDKNHSSTLKHHFTGGSYHSPVLASSSSSSSSLLSSSSSPSSQYFLNTESRRKYNTSPVQETNASSIHPLGVVERNNPMIVDKREDNVEFIIDPPPPHPHSSSDLLDPYNDLGRSCASYSSDIDSESGDDISLDDSASDKSDGSEGMTHSVNPGSSHMTSGLIYNNLGVPYGNDALSSYSTSTARIMAWNRIQQQQRREQYILQSRGSMTINSSQPCSSSSLMGLSDSDYQSGDSIDSMMAEDSEGSESSCSDA